MTGSVDHPRHFCMEGPPPSAGVGEGGLRSRLSHKREFTHHIDLVTDITTNEPRRQSILPTYPGEERFNCGICTMITVIKAIAKKVKMICSKDGDKF